MINRTVTIEREGKYWLVYIDGTTGLTQARRYEEVTAMAREYVALVENVPLHDVTIDAISVKGASETLAQAIADRQTAAALEMAATRQIREIARKLRADSVPLTEIGQIMGVSHQRVAQLLKAA